MESTADWSQFLSVAAQSAATLVAIIGGFFLSRLIQLAVDRANLGQQYADLHNETRELKSRLEEARRRLVLYHAGEFVSNVFGRIVTAGWRDVHLATLSEHYRRTHPRLSYEIGSEFDELEQRLARTIPEAFSEFEQLKGHGEFPPTLREYRSTSGVERNLLEDRIYALAFQVVGEHGNIFGYGPLHIQEYLLTDAPQDLAVRSKDEYEALAEEWRKFLEQRHQSDLQLGRASEELRRSARPPGFWSAIFVLVYLLVGGVVAPLWYLGLQPPVNPTEPALDIHVNLPRWLPGYPVLQPGVSFSDQTLVLHWTITHWQFVFALFLSGLVLLFSHMIYLWRRLTRKPSQQAPTIWADEQIAPMPLPERPRHYPDARDQERNMFHNYLYERGIQVQTSPDGDGGYRVAFSYQNKEYEFTGPGLDDTEAMRKAYLTVYEMDREELPGEL